MFCHSIFKMVFGERQVSCVFIQGMRLLVLFLNAMPLYVVNFEMLEWQTNEMDKRILKAMFNTFTFLCLLSYFKASITRPKVIPQMAPNERDKNYCVTCRNWKPQRTHHCSICGVCVPKMDHHCPWLGNCVGYHNFKAFFLFCFYQAIVGIIYLTQMINYAFLSPDSTPVMTIGGQICYWMTNVFGMLISAALIPLSIRILLQMYNNITTLEMMHDKMFRYPCFGAAEKDRDGNKLTPNEYDMLWLPNMKQVLGPSLWMWPFPFAPDIKGEGLFFPRLPDVSSTDLKSNE